jgi:hypothetical protein
MSDAPDMQPEPPVVESLAPPVVPPPPQAEPPTPGPAAETSTEQAEGLASVGQVSEGSEQAGEAGQGKRPKKKRHPNYDPLVAATKTIAKRLNEPKSGLIRKVVELIGPPRAYAFMEQTLTIEAEGGMTITDGSRRRTPGGVFLHLVRTNVSDEERHAIWPRFTRTQRRQQDRAREAERLGMTVEEYIAHRAANPEPTQPAHSATPKVPKADPGIPWADRAALVHQASTERGLIQTVKMTLIGRPGKIVQQGQTIVTTMRTTGKAPALPKGVPTPPEIPMTYIVYMPAKQWNKVAEFLQDPEDVLIIEGFPTFDPELKKMTLLAMKVMSKLQQRSQRQPKPGQDQAEAKPEA